MQGYDPNLLSRYIGLSKKPHQALSILVIPIHEKMASGPWTSCRVITTGTTKVRTGHGKHGKSWKMCFYFPGLENVDKHAFSGKVIESHG